MVFANKTEFDSVMQAVLHKIIDSKFPNGDTLSDNERFALKECVDNEYVEGVVVTVMISGRIVVDYSYPRVTGKGYAFLASLESANNAAQHIAENKRIEDRNKIPWYESSLFWGIIGIAVTVALAFYFQ